MLVNEVTNGACVGSPELSFLEYKYPLAVPMKRQAAIREAALQGVRRKDNFTKATGEQSLASSEAPLVRHPRRSALTPVKARAASWARDVSSSSYHMQLHVTL